MHTNYIHAAPSSIHSKQNYFAYSNHDKLCIGHQIPPIPIENILFIESCSNYSIFYLMGERKVVTSKTLKYWQEKLYQHYTFIRCHASFLVNLNCIHSFDRSSKSIELLNKSKVVCSRRKYNEVIKVLKKNQSIQWVN